MAHDHDHDHDHEHDHGQIFFLKTEVDEGAVAEIRATHAPLADVLDLTRRWGELTDDEKKAAAEKQKLVETADLWMPGYHAEGDKCATCGAATRALFVDRFQEGALPYGAFLHSLPVHPTRACLDGFGAKRKDLSPRGLDKARRETSRDLDRPSPRLTQFFRHDLLAHPPFGLEDWATSVVEANPDGVSRATMKDIERLARYVHGKLFH